jgi:nicotinamidase/pyrazinamidase
MKALIIVDMQHDFLPDGSLAVPRSNEIIQTINNLQTEYDLVIATQDWHPKDHKSFAANHPGKALLEIIDLNGLEQKLWPVHCVQGTTGAAITSELNQDNIAAVFQKGMNKEVDSYSGFFDNDKVNSTGLDDYLQSKGVTEVAVCGLAAEYCVYFTATDALELGFKTSIIEDATRPISQQDFDNAKQTFKEKGGFII